MRDRRPFRPPLPALVASLLVALVGLVPGTATARARTTATGTDVRGRVTEAGGTALPGMAVQALPSGATGCAQDSGCVSAYSGRGGRYILHGLAPGRYAIDVLDGSGTVTAADVRIAAGPGSTRSVSQPLLLGPAAVPLGTAAGNARRDLRRLNAERARDGVPADVVENPRWSQECAAHDGYEAANDVLAPIENPVAPGASSGGAWAGRSGVLAQGRWTREATPWESAPVHLLALLAPSLSVTGIDDTGTYQCAITFPGMLRAAPGHDALTTVPADRARRVAASELARETPFTPVRFAGLPAARPTGRELFVYLNRPGTAGQSAVHITRATLRRGRRPVAVRVVDSGTRTIGPYLAGGILIPVHPLARTTTYRATVAVADGDRTLTRSWSFTTR